MHPRDLAPAHIREIAPYVPGKPIAETARELGLDPAEILKLASNENPLGSSPKAIAALRGALGDLAWYPDGSGHDLKEAISRKLAVSPANVVLGNGSNDVLELVARAFLTPADTAVFSRHAFMVYLLVVKVRKSLLIPKNVRRAVRVLREGRPRPVNLMEIEGQISGFSSIGGTALATNTAGDPRDGRPCGTSPVSSCFEAMPNVTNQWNRLSLDATYYFRPAVGVGFTYWYEKFEVTDFATVDSNGPVGFTAATGTPRIDYLGGLILGYGNRPYEGNTGFVRLLYLF